MQHLSLRMGHFALTQPLRNELTKTTTAKTCVPRENLTPSFLQLEWLPIHVCVKRLLSLIAISFEYNHWI